MRTRRVLFAFISIIITIALLTSCVESTPQPEIKSGEFNFSVTYEYAGEIQTISGVYVCEYAGTSWALDGGFGRDWRGYIKGNTTEDNIVLGTAEDGGVVELYLAFDPDCFMGDSYMVDDQPFQPILSVRLVNEGLYFENDPEILIETYGARIIGYEYDEPIENVFK